MLLKKIVPLFLIFKIAIKISTMTYKKLFGLYFKLINQKTKKKNKNFQMHKNIK